MKASHFILLLSATLILANTHRAEAGKPTIVRNAAEPPPESIVGNRLTLSANLVIGSEDDIQEEMLGRVADIAVDQAFNVYVLDQGFTRVQKFDSTGTYLQTIGRDGQGPGEFNHPTELAIDRLGYLLVADRINIGAFDTDGVFVESFRHEIFGGVVASLEPSPTGDLFATCYDMSKRKMIHKISADHEIADSFCDSHGVGTGLDLVDERANAFGKIAIATDGTVFYTQGTPYEIRKFSANGDLLTRIYRDNTFPKPTIEKKADSRRYTMGAVSVAIFLVDGGRLLNVLVIPPVDGEGEMETVIDVFDREGNLLSTHRQVGRFVPQCMDARGRIYAPTLDDFPTVVRYDVSFE